ncbi:hypothetical protein [Sphingomonas jatrophae]|uniref:Uncharacterized protein n=1 Tax=Sphingomonas jatrophae TaxID=1166337 RepID=A0A1I6L2L1_9SPHN|nr:hypothetical protein [Sphingomonas jatrophae]SFR97686.1 hypothetical protein SAMN05192580_2194 [Sphingomonas jatrophae]
MDEPADSDRFRHLDEREQRIAALRRDGHDVIDRQGRARAVLGKGSQSRVVVGSTPMRAPAPRHSSDVITEAEFRRMYEAVATANVQRMILNTFVTVSWSVGGVRHAGYAGHLHARFLELMRTWANYEGGRPKLPYGGIWVKEVGKVLGLHSHFLMHVPGEHFTSFRTWARRAAHKLAEVPAPDRRRVQPKERLILSTPLGDSTREQWKVFNYLMKGVDPEGILNLHQYGNTHLSLLLEEFDRRVVPQGVIEGPRVGRTRSLGPQALAAAERIWGKVHLWPDAYDLEDLRMGDHFLTHGELYAQLKVIRETGGF